MRAADIGEAMREGAKMKTRAKEATNIGHRRRLDAKLAAGNSLTVPYAVCTVTVPKTYSIGDFAHQLEASVRRAGFALRSSTWPTTSPSQPPRCRVGHQPEQEHHMNKAHPHPQPDYSAE